MMGRLALSAVRAHPSAYLAAAGVIGVGTALLTSFAALAETGLAAPANRGESMTMLAVIMGGWSVAIVVFGIASTVTLVVRQRGRELALLRSIGATPRQVRRMVLLETVTVAVPALVAGVLPGIGLGAFLLTRMVSAGVVDGPVDFVSTWRTLISGAGIALFAAVLAAMIAGGRAAKIAPVSALTESSGGTAQSVVSTPKLWFGLAFLVGGLGSGLGTLFMADGPLLAAAAGPACVGVAIGLALLCPIAVGGLGRIADAVPNAMARLAIRNLAARATGASSVIGPLAMLVGIATGTLYMQYTENGSPPIAGDDIGAQFAVANYLVVAMIIAFCGIAVTNSLIAATWERRREFAGLRLTASTRDQVLSMIIAESALATALAIVLGTVAAATTIIPYALVKTGSPIPHGSAISYLAIIGGTALIACLTTLSTAVRATRTRPAVVLAGA